MAEIGRWWTHTFEVSPTLIRGFSGLQVKGGSETDTKTSGKHKYVTWKNTKPMEISLTISLNHLMGCDVRAEAIDFVENAYCARTDYFYVGNKKLLQCKLMLVDATVKEITILPNGTWAKAQVSLTMKQANKYGSSSTSTASSGSSSRGSSGGSSKKTSTKTKKKTTGKKTVVEVDAITGAAPHVAKTAKVTNTIRSIVSAATKTIAKITSAAKKLTTKKKTTKKVSSKSVGKYTRAR